MAISNFIPEIWTQDAQQILMKKLVAEKVVNRAFEGQITGPGDKLHIVTCGALTDAAYASENITYEALSDADTTLDIDLKRYVAFEVSDLDKIQSKPEFVTKFTQQAAYQIGDYFDGLLLAEYANATINSFSDDSSTAWQFDISDKCPTIPNMFAQIQRKLAVANAPAGQPYVIVPPQVVEAVGIWAGGRASGLADQIVQNGFAGKMFGFNVYVSNNCTTAASVTHGLAGIEGEGVALAYQVNKVEALRLEGRFSDGVRMLVVGGIKTYRPAIMVDINLNETVLTA